MFLLSVTLPRSPAGHFFCAALDSGEPILACGPQVSVNIAGLWKGVSPRTSNGEQPGNGLLPVCYRIRWHRMEPDGIERGPGADLAHKTGFYGTGRDRTERG